MKTPKLALLAAALVLPQTIPSFAADAQSCKTIRLSDPGWTDITSTNALASTVLEALGYEPQVETLSVQIGYESIKNKDIDVFLGNWMPAQQNYREALDAENAVEVLAQNLEGAKFTLAVPDYVAEAGVEDFADLASNADKFDKSIYGIEPGAPANVNIQKMIDSGDFGLSGWELVESSEQGMLSQVARAERSDGWIVFLAWAPHPMNTLHDITYLSGGDEYFGPDYGGAQVFTLARTGYSEECPNAAKLFSNLKFTVDMENEMMNMIINEGTSADDAAEAYLEENPDLLDGWLEGVTTLEGKPGLEAVKTALGF